MTRVGRGGLPPLPQPIDRGVRELVACRRGAGPRRHSQERGVPRWPRRCRTANLRATRHVPRPLRCGSGGDHRNLLGWGRWSGGGLVGGGGALGGRAGVEGHGAWGAGSGAGRGRTGVMNGGRDRGGPCFLPCIVTTRSFPLSSPAGPSPLKAERATPSVSLPRR